LVALAAYVWDCRQGEAAERLGRNWNSQAKRTGTTPAGRTASSQWNDAGERRKASGSRCGVFDAYSRRCTAPPVAHSRHGKPAGRWAYRDAAGVVCFYHDRYEPKGERKQFAPLSLWRFPDGRLAWQFKAPAAPRPLLGLPELAAAEAGCPVVIVEGEKARDAAAVLFEGCPVITWQGGAQAVSKADWSPLAAVNAGFGPITTRPEKRQCGRCGRVGCGEG
jgi:hypothetical protein